MCLRHILIAIFIGYALFLLLFGGPLFGQAMATTTYATAAMSLVIAMLFVINRCFVLNFMIAVYVASTFFLMPWFERLFVDLEPQQIVFLEDLRRYYDPRTSSRVCLFVLLCLVGWLLGLALSPGPASRPNPSVPRVFRTLDSQIYKRGLSFWLVLAVLVVLNTRSTLSSGWGAVSGESEGALLFYGLLNPGFVGLACLVGLLYAAVAGQVRRHYVLLLPSLPSIGVSMFMGGRGALYYTLLISTFCFIVLKGPQFRVRIRTVLLITSLAFAAVVLATIANAARPLWRDSAGAAAIRGRLTDDILSGKMLENSGYSVATLLVRQADLLGPFYVINDNYVFEPWQSVNPVESAKRIVNALVPGDVFSNVLTINQLFNWIYMGDLVVYNSESWSMFAMPYLYFGFLGGPFVFFWFALILHRFYGTVIAKVRASPSFAVFVISFTWTMIVNGMVERAIPNDIWAVVLVCLIFSTMVKVANSLLGGFGGVRHPTMPHASKA